MRSPSKPFAHQGGVVVLAHRGFSGRYPQNTLLAFEKAVELPVDGLEMDIYPTKDDVLVVSHSDDVSNTTNGEGKIQSHTLAQLKELDAGYRFTPDDGETYPFRDQGVTIPTLEDVFSRFQDVWINIDIKEHEPYVVELFCALIRRHDNAEQLCVGSFSDETVAQFREACPEVVSLATPSEITRLFFLNLLRLSGLFDQGGHAMQIPPQRAYLGFSMDVVSSRFVENAHRHDMAVHLWTLNEREEMSHYVDVGVDGIITDYPDRALRVLGRLSDAGELARS
jgi:glycerophosphoryl diester phosphodiesterase